MERYARVAVCLPVAGAFHFRIPPRLLPHAVPGTRAAVPFGGRRAVGFILGVEETCPVELARVRDLEEILDRGPVLPLDLLELGRWLAAYYHHPLGETLAGMIPPAARASSRAVYEAEGEKEAPELSPGALALLEKIRLRPLSASSLKTTDRAWLEELCGAGLVRRRWRVETAEAPRGEKWCSLGAAAPAPGALGANRARLAELIDLLGRGPLPLAEARRRNISADTVSRAAAKGWIVVTDAPPEAADPAPFGYGAEGDRAPTPDQRAALDAVYAALEGEKFATFLLHGATGSGKTEVYLRAAEEALRRGRAVLVLVPEIALTPQLVGRFSSRLGSRLVLLHSGLPERERRLQWEAARSGRARVVVGTRSAVFAPLPGLGLVVVDEEHDPGYKQEDGLRYNAKHAALVRAREAGAVVILGSATPDLESWEAARRGRYVRLHLPHRIGAAGQPEVRIVDLKAEERRLGRAVLVTRPLQQAVAEAVSRGEQALLFLNRRGYSPNLYCPACGETRSCVRCSVPLTLHKSGGVRLVCHYCGHEAVPERVCPACGTAELVPLGAGTQKVEGEIAALWPGARVARLDRDAAGGGGPARILETFSRGGCDILVGTQMVAKGHHFPKLTVVGVLFADEALHLPDFRAAERTFQIVSQVAGRAGREERAGVVYLQTRTPGHPVLEAAARGDYEAFAEKELGERRAAGFPPFRRLALLRALSPDRRKGEAALAEAGRRIEKLGRHAGVEVLGPAPAPVERIRGKYRHHLLLRGPNPLPGQLQSVLRKFLETWKPPSDVTIQIDVDPLRLL